MFATPKSILARNHVVGVFCVKIRPESCKNPKNPKTNSFCAQSHACAETKPLGGSLQTFAQVYKGTTM